MGDFSETQKTLDENESQRKNFSGKIDTYNLGVLPLDGFVFENANRRNLQQNQMHKNFRVLGFAKRSVICVNLFCGKASALCCLVCCIKCGCYELLENDYYDQISNIDDDDRRVLAGE